ncbi:hypothetical protein [Spirillospora sp. CA-128828]|uniref:hypothetical protein n=1 Tax=Spirillospora sp. CA-128828 TaxID=3240033 RepID=UPI003D902E92
MGARANFALIDEDGLRLHYSHWGADRVCSALVAGPVAAGRFISAQHRCDDPSHDWLDDAWAEGGAVVDHTARNLVFYGGQLLLELPCKRDPPAALDGLISGIARERGPDPVPGMLDAVRGHAGDREVELNPYFTAHRQVDASGTEWEAVLSAATDLRARLAAGS